MPTKPLANGERSVRSQADRRYIDTFYDEHKSARFPNGRPWCGYREFLSGSERPSSADGFVTPELQKGDHNEPERSNWDAPWVPEFNGGKFNFYDFDFERKRIRIRYDRVIAYDSAEEDKYYLAAAKVSAINGWAPVVQGKTPSFQVTSLQGMPPRSPRIARAAQAGDPWILGLSSEPNDVLAELLGITSAGFQRPIPTAEPPLPPEKVLATPPEDLAVMIAKIVAATLDAREKQKQERRKTHGEKVREGRARALAARQGSAA